MPIAANLSAEPRQRTVNAPRGASYDVNPSAPKPVPVPEPAPPVATTPPNAGTDHINTALSDAGGRLPANRLAASTTTTDEDTGFPIPLALGIAVALVGLVIYFKKR